MFDIRKNEHGVILLFGRLDASQTEKAKSLLDGVAESRTVDCSGLDYISSAGLGVLLATQKRLGERGQGLTLANLNEHIRDIFRVAGLDAVFRIE